MEGANNNKAKIETANNVENEQVFEDDSSKKLETSNQFTVLEKDAKNTKPKKLAKVDHSVHKQVDKIDQTNYRPAFIDFLEYFKESLAKVDEARLKGEPELKIKNSL